MILNQYVGELSTDVDFDTFLKSVKTDARKAQLSTDSIKMKNKDGSFFVQCGSDVANLIRKRSEVIRFRCDKIGLEQDKPTKAEKE